MAKKKAAKKKSSTKRKSSKAGINTSKLMGMAGGIFLAKKGLPRLSFFTNLDPKMQGVALMVAGEFGVKQDFVKNMLKDTDMLDGAGNALTVTGMTQLMTEMGIAGIGAPNDSDELAVAIEGIDDIDDIGDNKYLSKRRRSEDISVIDEDVLGDEMDTVNEDVLGDDDDDSMGDDDISTIDEDVLGDDDDDF